MSDEGFSCASQAQRGKPDLEGRLLSVHVESKRILTHSSDSAGLKSPHSSGHKFKVGPTGRSAETAFESHEGKQKLELLELWKQQAMNLAQQSQKP